MRATDSDPSSDVAAGLRRLSGTAVTRVRAVGGGHGARHYAARLGDGQDVFVKAASQGALRPPSPAGAGQLADGEPAPGSIALAAEAAGLRWLGEAGAVPVPEVLFSDNGLLVLTWIPRAGADRAAAERFGGDLARLHAFGADRFGAPWRGVIASLPLANEPADTGPQSWPEFYAQRRVLPYARLARDAGTLSAADVALVEQVAGRLGELAGPAEPPSRIHGDCWSGNLLWSGGRGWLIDPAAHGGHRETDLAMLALFGAPYLDTILAAYDEAAPLADGWRRRVPLHQLHPLLVHVCLFGAGYREPALAAARAALAA
jgi:fructosamine-3-kinase